MKIKKSFYRWVRRRRRNLARFILGFENCPIDNPKSFKAEILRGALISMVSACMMFVFVFFVIATM